MQDPLPLSAPVFLTGVLALGIFAQWLAWRLRLPSILLLLAFGFMARYLAGADPDAILGHELLFSIVSLSVAVILFEGGLTLKWHDLRESGNVVWRLVTVGVLVSWVLTAVLARWLIGMDTKIAVLMGAILVVTGPTVIVPLLRHVRPGRKLSSIVKWEGIVIDPIGALLTVLVFEVLISGALDDASLGVGDRALRVASILATTVGIGVVLSGLAAILLVQLLRRYWVPDFLHTAVFLSVAVLTFTLSNLYQSESGLLTVTLLGIFLANQRTVAVKHVIEFKENLRVLLISSLFIVLAARIELSHIRSLGWSGFWFLAALIVMVRPLATLASTWRSNLTTSERVFLAFMAPRGIVAAAVTSVFALRVSLALEPGGGGVGAEQMVSVTFLVIVGTVALYGLLAVPLARFLKLAVPNPQGILIAGASPWVQQIGRALQEEEISVLLVDTNYHNVANASMEGLPAQCASILSEYVSEELDLSGIGRFMALTPNNELNRLAAMEYVHDFGRAEVYQLPPWDHGGGRRQSYTPHARGRVLFDESLTFQAISRRFDEGAEIKRTKITDEFGFVDFQARYGENAIVLFLVDSNGQLTVATSEATLSPKSGEMVIALVDPATDSATTEQSDTGTSTVAG